MYRVLLLEDNSRLADLITGALKRVGITIDSFGDNEAAEQALQFGDYAALIIDRGLPDGDGLALVQRLRAAGKGTPCLIVTARDAVHDRIDGLERGADDYLTKPFAMEELVARVKALIRRPVRLQSLSPVLGDLTLRPDDGLLVCAGQTVSLPPAELQIMYCLIQSEQSTVSRRTLEQAAWGLSEAVTPNALDVALHRLRRKLTTLGSTLQIVNSRARGYALQDVASDP